MEEGTGALWVGEGMERAVAVVVLEALEARAAMRGLAALWGVGAWEVAMEEWVVTSAAAMAAGALAAAGSGPGLVGTAAAIAAETLAGY